jgi:hypothetical protein
VFDWNFGEPITLKPATIPYELLQQQSTFQVPNNRPTTLDKNTLLAVRLLFNQIELNFLTQVEADGERKDWEKFAKANFERAKITYECSMAQAEMNILCEGAEFIDSRGAVPNYFSQFLPLIGSLLQGLGLT